MTLDVTSWPLAACTINHRVMGAYTHACGAAQAGLLLYNTWQPAASGPSSGLYRLQQDVLGPKLG